MDSGLLLLTAAVPFTPAARAEELMRAQGRCTFKHKQAGGVDAFVVKLDDGTDFSFSGPNPQALSVQTYAGIRSVRHQAATDHDVFQWNDGEERRLSVRLDHVGNPDAKFEDPAQKAETGSLLGAAVGALIGGLITGGNKSTRTEAATMGAPVGELQSLVGVKGASGEAELTHRGYTYRGGSAPAGTVCSRWEQPRTGNCVEVQTADGRYQKIVYTNKNFCR